MTLYNCPSCQRNVWQIQGTDMYSCECGMVFRAVTSDIHYAYGDDASRDEIRKVLESTLTVFKTKREEVNEMREHHKKLAVDYLLTEIMKGPLSGGTMAEPSSVCAMFGSDVWSALEKAILIRDPKCRICGQRESREVHHIRPRHLKGKDHPRNLVGLCLECHDEVHRRIDRGIQDLLEGSLGIPPGTAQDENQSSLADFGGDMRMTFFRKRGTGMLRLYDYVAEKNIGDMEMMAMASIRERPDMEDPYLSQLDLVRIFSENVRRDLERLMGASE